jgi:hypothetical protein
MVVVSFAAPVLNLKTANEKHAEGLGADNM